MKQLIIVRGPSGSGKSTLARYLDNVPADEGVTISIYCEADEFFVDPIHGEYYFNPKCLNYAHQLCRSKAAMAMYHKFHMVVVSNTTTTQRELDSYLDLAREFDYKVRVIRTPGPWDPNALFKRNKHNVPLDVIEKQIARYVEYDGEEEWSDMSIYK